MNILTMTPAGARFWGLVAAGAGWGALNAIAANIMGSGLVSGTVATIIIGVIGLLEQNFSGEEKSFFGSVYIVK